MRAMSMTSCLLRCSVCWLLHRTTTYYYYCGHYITTYYSLYHNSYYTHKDARARSRIHLFCVLVHSIFFFSFSFHSTFLWQIKIWRREAVSSSALRLFGSCVVCITSFFSFWLCPLNSQYYCLRAMTFYKKIFFLSFFTFAWNLLYAVWVSERDDSRSLHHSSNSNNSEEGRRKSTLVNMLLNVRYCRIPLQWSSCILSCILCMI